MVIKFIRFVYFLIKIKKKIIMKKLKINVIIYLYDNVKYLDDNFVFVLKEIF